MLPEQDLSPRACRQQARFRFSLVVYSSKSSNLIVSEAGDEVIVDKASSLHECMADSGTYEFETALFHIFTHVI